MKIYVVYSIGLNDSFDLDSAHYSKWMAEFICELRNKRDATIKHWDYKEVELTEESE